MMEGKQLLSKMNNSEFSPDIRIIQQLNKNGMILENNGEQMEYNYIRLSSRMAKLQHYNTGIQ